MSSDSPFVPTSPATDPTPAVARLRLYAERSPDGDVRDTFLLLGAEGLAIWSAPSQSAVEAPGEALGVPGAALPAIFDRYGKPLEEGLELEPLWAAEDEWDAPLVVATAAGPATLRRFRFLPFGWVHPADYLLWQPAGAEPVAAPAPLVASALFALARAAARRS